MVIRSVETGIIWKKNLNTVLQSFLEIDIEFFYLARLWLILIDQFCYIMG